jgi:hypothetical protein
MTSTNGYNPKQAILYARYLATSKPGVVTPLTRDGVPREP